MIGIGSYAILVKIITMRCRLLSISLCILICVTSGASDSTTKWINYSSSNPTSNLTINESVSSEAPIKETSTSLVPNTTNETTTPITANPRLTTSELVVSIATADSTVASGSHTSSQTSSSSASMTESSSQSDTDSSTATSVFISTSFGSNTFESTTDKTEPSGSQSATSVEVEHTTEQSNSTNTDTKHSLTSGSITALVVVTTALLIGLSAFAFIVIRRKLRTISSYRRLMEVQLSEVEDESTEDPAFVSDL